MSQRFIKFNPDSEKTDFLMENHPNAFLLLCLIAKRARRVAGKPDGLIIGDAILGDPKKAGLSRQNYRTALNLLVELGLIKIIANGHKFFEREKSTIKITIKGTLVNLCSSEVWDINSNDTNQQNNQQPTNSQPQTRKNKNEKEIHHPQTPSLQSATKDDRLIDDFSKNKIKVYAEVYLTQDELDECIAYRGSLEAVEAIVKEIIEWPERKYEIKNWVKSIRTWNPKNNVADRILKNQEIGKTIESKYDNPQNNWIVRHYRDHNKSDAGILFEPKNANGGKMQIFISYAEADFENRLKESIKKTQIKQKESKVI